MRRPTKTNDEILLAPQEYDHIGVADFCRGAIQAALEKSESVRMIVGNKSTRLLFGHDRHARGFDETLQSVAGQRVTSGAAGDCQRPARFAQERDGAAHELSVAQSLILWGDILRV